MADGFDHAVLGQAPPCTFHEQCGAQFGHDRCGQSRREEFVPHCSKSWPRAAMGTMGGGSTYVEGATEDTGCLRAKLERAIDCMRLIASRTKFARSLKLSLRMMSALPLNLQLCACTPALNG